MTGFVFDVQNFVSKLNHSAIHALALLVYGVIRYCSVLYTVA